jgi:hypothetical protein
MEEEAANDNPRSKESEMISNKFWLEKLQSFVKNAFEDPQRTKVTTDEAFNYLTNLGMPPSNYRSRWWVQYHLLRMEIPHEVVIGITESEELPMHKHVKAEDITIYGRISSIDENYDYWHSCWWDQGRRGGVLKHHQKFLLVRNRIALVRHYRENGLSEENIQKLTTEDNVLKFTMVPR